MVISKYKIFFLFLLLFCLSAVVFFVPTTDAFADDGYSIPYNEPVCAYGDLLFGKLTNSTIIDEAICIYGYLKSSSFIFVSACDDDNSITHKLVIQSLKVLCVNPPSADSSAEPFDLIDSDGRVIVKPGVYKVDLDSSLLRIYEKDAEPGAKIISNVLSFGSSGGLSITVKRREIKVSLNYDAVEQIEETDNEGKTKVINKIERTFDSEPLDLQFVVDASTPLAFPRSKDEEGNLVGVGEQLVCSAAFKGNDRYSDVGDYDVTLSTSNDETPSTSNDETPSTSKIDIISYVGKESTLVSGCYTIICEQNIRITVKPLQYIVPSVLDTAEYGLESYDYKGDFSPDGSFLTISISFSLPTDNRKKVDKDGKYSVSTSEEDYHEYDVAIFNIKNGDDDIAVENVQLVASNTYRLNITKKEICIYPEGTPEPEDSGLPIALEGFSNEYGQAYPKDSSQEIEIDNSKLLVHFSIVDEEFMAAKNKPDALIIDNDKVVLDVGEYGITGAYVDDERYIVKISDELKYIVKSKEITLSELFDSGSLPESIVKAVDGSFCIGYREYGGESGENYTHDITFERTFSYGESTLTDDRKITFVFPVTATTLPGVYHATSALLKNYVLTDYQDVTIVVKKIPLSIVLESFEYGKKATVYIQCEYNKVRKAVDCFNADSDSESLSTTDLNFVEGSPCGLVVEYCLGPRFNDEKKCRPTVAGNYIARVTINEGASDANFCFITENRESELAYKSFEVLKRPVDVEIIKNVSSRRFGEKTKSSSLVTVKCFYHDGALADARVPGLLGTDMLWAVTCEQAADTKALPGKYDIVFDKTDSFKNYSIKSTKCDGKEISLPLKFEIIKLTEEDISSSLLDCTGEKPEYNSVIFPDIYFKNVKLNGVGIKYKKANDNSAQFVYSEELTVNNLEEGTTYIFKYVLSINNQLFQLSNEIEGSEKEITTLLAKPEIEQLYAESDSMHIPVRINNYSPNNTYFGVLGEEEFEILNKYITTDEANPDIGILDISDHKILLPNTSYEFKLVRKTTDNNAESQSITVWTAAAKPQLSKAEVAVSDKTITLNGDTSVLYRVEYIKAVSGHSTVGSLSADDNDELKSKFANPDAEIFSVDGLSLEDLESNTVYYVKVYVLGDENINPIGSDPIYFEIHTEKAEEVPSALLTFIEKSSGYLSVSMLGLFFVLFLIVLIRFIYIKKKLRRA